MPAVSGRNAGYTATLYRVNAAHAKTALTATAAAGLTIANNKIIDVTTMGALTKERSVITFNIYGEDTEGSIPGQAAAITFDYTVVLNLDNAAHTSIRDDAGTANYGWLIYFYSGANEKTWAYFNGAIASATVDAPYDNVNAMNVSVALDGGIRWVNAA